MRNFDVVFLGAGSATEWLTQNLSGKSIAVIESKRVGGECPYVACVPSKAMLRSAHVRRTVLGAHLYGAVAKPVLLDDAEEAFRLAIARRDEIAENLDDEAAVKELDESGVELFRGFGRILGPGRMGIFENAELTEEISWSKLVIDTGSSPKLAPIEGLANTPFWTSEDALTSAELPDSLCLIGGGAISCELADFYSAFGTRVTILEASEHIVPKEDPEVAAVLRRALEGHGIEIIENAAISSITYEDGCFNVKVNGCPDISSARLLAATGREPNLSNIGLDAIGVEANSKGLSVDEFCRVRGAQNIYAAGDVTGLVPFTHGAKYQARIILSHMFGVPERARYDLVPRCIYTDPPVASVGRTSFDQDEQRSIRAESFEVASTARALTDGQDQGLLRLYVDTERGILAGASMIGPYADELISEVTLAIAAAVPVATFARTTHPFPTFSEIFEASSRNLS